MLIDAIHARCLKLADNPKLGRAREELAPGIRSFPHGRYVIFYRLTPAAVQIVRVLSGYRDVAVLLR